MTDLATDTVDTSLEAPIESGDSDTRRPLPQRWLLQSIVWYQKAREGRPSPCRFFPSCSSYALEAVDVHGARRGTWLATKRLARCRPLGPSGFDPVPEPAGAHDTCAHTHPDSSPDPIAGQR